MPDQSSRLISVVFAGAACAIAGGAVHAQTIQFTEVSNTAGILVQYRTTNYLHDHYGGGGAVGDFDGDGWQDLFLFSGGLNDVSDLLYMNNGDGTFTDEAAAWGLDTPRRGRGATVGDFNGDGHLDLFMTSHGVIGGATSYRGGLWRNNGNGTFTDIASTAGVQSMPGNPSPAFGATFGDYDLDGDLDLFVAGFNGHSENRLYRNNGNETFTDVTAASGMYSGTPSSISGMSPQLIDMDGDRYPDLLLVADFGTSRYFRNNGDGTFTDFTNPADTSQESDGMGQCVGDFDRDGLPDWYVTSIDYTPASPCFSGNKLYYNTGAHSYDEVSCAKGVDTGGWGWGTVAADFDNDGRLDLAETNGAPHTGYTDLQSNLWMQNALGTFDEIATTVGISHFGQGRGMVQFDYDNDGDRDIVIMAFEERAKLYRNDLSGPNTNWLKVWLDTSNEPALAPKGIGAVVRLTIGAETQSSFVLAGCNYLTASEFSSHFGMGAATTADELRVEWPNGETTIVTNVSANQTLTITYGDTGPAGDLTGDGTVGFADLSQLLAGWGPCVACPEDLDGDGNVGFTDLNIMLGNWG